MIHDSSQPKEHAQGHAHALWALGKMQAAFSDLLQVSFTNILRKCGKRSGDQGHLC
jgi:hypothetical protein